MKEHDITGFAMFSAHFYELEKAYGMNIIARAVNLKLAGFELQNACL